MPLSPFHPVLQRWFEENLGVPTEAQARAWAAIREGRHTLVAAPTGSGKTLAAFYAVIDDLVVRGLRGELPSETQVVYVSPLKALSNDIHRNLEVPLGGISKEIEKKGVPDFRIAVAVRTGDTTASERQRMAKNPPHILVTTPESLYLLLTSDGGRKMLKSVRTLIVDEIHALVADKRGSHLALSAERLEALTGKPLQRIGLSATQKPVELVAKFLTGTAGGDCAVIDTGHRRKLEVKLEVPKSPLTAVMSNEVWGELYERLVELISQNRTTLVFVNTRRLAERLARALAERIGDGHVSSHHGSMSKEHRHRAEKRLKAGELKVLVATASMELGIDIGSVDLVVQFSSPKRIASFLQRVGRSGHNVGGVSKGIVYPLSRDELVECAALLDAVRRGELDRIEMPEEPLDILAQQIVAEASCGERTVDELHGIFVRAYPYRNLTRERFTEIVRMLAEGYTTRRGRRGAYLHYDAVNGVIRARRGARLAALTNGGTIPDMFDYEVVLQPEGVTVGTLNEDFALESLPGDIFTLGTHSWQLLRIEGMKVMVADASGKPPTVPFWLGESSARSNELSEAVSRLRAAVGRMLDEDPPPLDAYAPASDESAAVMDESLRGHRAVNWLADEVGIDRAAAEQIVAYLWMGKVGLGVMPTRETIVMERFFDETGDMHLVIHSPYGSRVNRGWGLALRKKFCRRFNFELQAAATENSIILSLSSSHSFPVEEVRDYLKAATVRHTLVQAMVDAPLFEIRWRADATRALAVLRNRGGTRVPPALQRMQAEDLIAQVFPDQIACAENLRGEIEIPDHPLVRQVVKDCLTEAMDIETLEALFGKLESGEVALVAKDVREPSVFAQEVINARPYAFLDDTEFAERRVNAIKNRGWLDPSEARDLGRLDPEAIRLVREEAWPEARDAEELHDALLVHGFVTESEGASREWGAFFDALAAAGRAARFPAAPGAALWVAAERVPHFRAVYENARFSPRIQLPPELDFEIPREEALKEIVRGRLEALGPVTAAALAGDAALSESDVRYALGLLENEGFVFRGSFTPDLGLEEWCERRLLNRIHRTTVESLRQSVRPVDVQDFMRFLFERHGVDADEPPTGIDTLRQVIDRLEGFEAPAAAWETDLLPARMAGYDPAWLDMLCTSGRVAWGRFSPRAASDAGKKSGPVKSTPITLVSRNDVDLWRGLAGCEDRGAPLAGPAARVREELASGGALFFDQIVSRTGLLPSQAEEALAELVTNGLAAGDGYSGLRALLTPQANRPSGEASSRGRRNGRALYGIAQAGRWSLWPPAPANAPLDAESIERLACVYLKRWGVLFRTLMEKEAFAPPWRDVVRVLRRMEMRGQLRGGRFVAGVSGEQYAYPETVEELRRVKKREKSGKTVSVSAADPLNLLGTVLPGKRVAKLASNRILFEDGVPVAVYEGREIRFLREFADADLWRLKKALVRGKFPPKLRFYLGKNYA